jgi:hypothetical protein
MLFLPSEMAFAEPAAKRAEDLQMLSIARVNPSGRSVKRDRYPQASGMVYC